MDVDAPANSEKSSDNQTSANNTEGKPIETKPNGNNDKPKSSPTNGNGTVLTSAKSETGPNPGLLTIKKEFGDQSASNLQNGVNYHPVGVKEL